jgi:endonuclease IV
MGYNIGLKLWSVNVGPYYEEAQRLYENNMFDYVELYVIPGTLSTLSKWKNLKIPFTIHCPHSAHGFNLSDHNKKENNFAIYKEVKTFADHLNTDYIIFHGGNRGNVEETANQLAQFRDSRALIENKPYFTLPGSDKVKKRCMGATPEEIQIIREMTGCGFCLDFGHAICSANAQKKEPYAYMEEFMELRPLMYHLAGCEDMTSTVDTHLHLSSGNQNPQWFKRFLPMTAKVTLETEKNSKDTLNDFIGDVQWIRSL